MIRISFEGVCRSLRFRYHGGVKPLGRVKLEWTPDFAYAIGLLTTDGCLSKDMRHLSLCSKDREVITTFCRCLRLGNKISKKISSYTGRRDYYQVQFGDVLFYNFLLGIGLHSAKSKTLGELSIPDKCFADFLRGCIDGDGNINIVSHPESRHLQLRVRLVSASPDFLRWIHERAVLLLSLSGGWIRENKNGNTWELAYGKSDSVLLLNYMYYPGVGSFLQRKFRKAQPFLRMWPNW